MTHTDLTGSPFCIYCRGGEWAKFLATLQEVKNGMGQIKHYPCIFCVHIHNVLHELIVLQSLVVIILTDMLLLFYVGINGNGCDQSQENQQMSCPEL